MRCDMNTRKLSNTQEKRIAKNIGGRQVIGSGSTPFLKGDVTTSDLFIEAKTKAKESKSISVKKEWLEKAKEQSYSMRKRDYALAISFGDGKDYYVIEDSFMDELYKSRAALEAVIDSLGGIEDPLVDLPDLKASGIRKLIRRVLENE
nr:MAG TPA: hypothetical protein [Caudoviricetes sp.]